MRVWGLLTLLIAESGLSPVATRFGNRTNVATLARAMGEWARLQEIVDEVWPDISFGYSQQIVKYHWAGDGTGTVENVLTVMQAVFSDPEKDVAVAASRLAACLAQAQMRGYADEEGDILEALYIYNWGHTPTKRERKTLTFIANREGYVAALERAREVLTPPPS